MNGPFVLDASLTLSWAFDDEATAFTIKVPESLAPALWPFEVAGVLAVAEQRGRINADQQAEFLERLRLLPVMIEHRPAIWLGQQILPLARAYRLSAYDAAYLELAIRERLPLAIVDVELKAAASAAGIPLVDAQL